MNTYKGIVEKGDGLAGRDYGVPTANLMLGHDIGIDFGVYAARTKCAAGIFNSTVCYGVGSPPKFEVHLLGFDGNLLGKEIEVEILERISELVPWQSLERMRQKILHDIEMAKEIFKSHDKTK